MEHLPEYAYPKTRVFVEDHTGNNQRQINIASNAPVRQLTEAIVTAIGLPLRDNQGVRISYHLSVGERILTDNETFQSVGVAEGTVVRLLPQPTAAGVTT